MSIMERCIHMQESAPTKIPLSFVDKLEPCLKKHATLYRRAKRTGKREVESVLDASEVNDINAISANMLKNTACIKHPQSQHFSITQFKPGHVAGRNLPKLWQFRNYQGL